MNKKHSSGTATSARRARKYQQNLLDGRQVEALVSVSREGGPVFHPLPCHLIDSEKTSNEMTARLDA